MISTQPVHCDHCEMCTSEICLTLLRFVHQLCHHNFALQITFAFGHIQPTIQREVLTRCSSKLWCEHWAGRWSWQTGSSPFCAYFYILILNSVVWWYSHVMIMPCFLCVSDSRFHLFGGVTGYWPLIFMVNMFCCVVCVTADLISQECGGGGVTVLGWVMPSVPS